MSANAPQLVEAVLMDAVVDGVSIVSKKKLLWMLGWSNDKPKAWSDLLSHWERMGRDRAELHGLEIGSKIVLFSSNKANLPVLENVSKWAD